MGDDGDASQRAPFSEDPVARLRRARILDAVVDVVCERGVAGASVGLVLARAKVSRHAFYERFDGLDECLIAVLDGALARAGPLVVEAFAQEGSWRDRMRGALAAMLAFFDEDPALARVCLVELGTATPVVRAHRERILAAFAGIVLARIESEVSHPSPLAAEGTYASVVGIVNARLVGDEQGPLLELLGPLMGVIVGPYVDEVQIAQEVRRGKELARQMAGQRWPQRPDHADLPVRVPDALLGSRAQLARLCLLYVAEQNARGLTPSNQEVVAGVGSAGRAQVSKLLCRLAAMGLLVKCSEGPGFPNAWSLTREGERVAQALAAQR